MKDLWILSKIFTKIVFAFAVFYFLGGALGFVALILLLSSIRDGSEKPYNPYAEYE